MFIYLKTILCGLGASSNLEVDVYYNVSNISAFYDNPDMEGWCVLITRESSGIYFVKGTAKEIATMIRERN